MKISCFNEKNSKILVLFFTLVSFILIFHILDLYLQQLYLPTWSVKVHSDATNLSISVKGVCRKIVYCGFDNRVNLLNDYDARGEPGNSFLYSKAHLNWARILLVKTVLSQCKDHSTSWIIYSDTDAYLESRNKAWMLLNGLEDSIHLIFQNGAWVLNSGVFALRNNKMSSQILEQWESYYDSNSTKDFFSEQYALSLVYRQRKSQSKHFPNGFLAWHIKGNIEYKTELSAIGRTFTARSGPALFWTTILIHFFYIVIILESRLSNYKKYISFKSSFSTSFPRRNSSNIQSACISIFQSATSKQGISFFIVLVSLIWLLLYIPNGNSPYGPDFSKWDYHHLLPYGRIMVRKESTMWVDALGQVHHGGFRWLLFKKYKESSSRLFGGFIICQVIEWSAILWIYPFILTMRVISKLLLIKYTITRYILSTIYNRKCR